MFTFILLEIKEKINKLNQFENLIREMRINKIRLIISRKR